jgi:hypothetical protein
LKSINFKLIIFYAFGIFFTAIIILLMVEIFLRVFDPLPSSIFKDRLNTKPNLELSIKNFEKSKKIDKNISVKFNEIGLRGDSLSEFHKSDISILLVGGSTTQCIYLSDGQTWGDLLKTSLQEKLGSKVKVSVMNAGLDGHSTFGHIKLLDIDGLLKKINPTHVIVMAGINDLAIFEKALLISEPEMERNADARDIKNRDSTTSFIINSYIYAYWKNFKNLDSTYALRNRGDIELNMSELPSISRDKSMSREKDYHERIRVKLVQSLYSDFGFKKRLMSIRDRVKNLVGAPVIFVTQAALYGGNIDPDTGFNLELWDLGVWSGASKWMALNEINMATLSLKSEGIPVIDLGGALEKRSDYFYDEIHFAKLGAAEVSNIISNQIYANRMITAQHTRLKK